MALPAILLRAAAAATTASGGGGRARLSGGGPSTTGGSNLNNRAVAALAGIQYANIALDKWIPGVTTSYQVTAQGGPQTSPKNVLHTALAIAFGLPTERRFASMNISVGIDHRSNTVTVHYAIGSLGVIDLIDAALNNISNMTPAEIGRKLIANGSPLLGFIAPVVERVAGGQQPGVVMQDLIAQMHGQMRALTGASQVWKMGAEDIKAGNIPSSLDMGGPAAFGVQAAVRQATIGAPILGDMTQRGKNKDNALMLTRDPARNGVPADRANPQPDIGGDINLNRANRGGVDLRTGFENLRTLVTQVLADPGIRPPLPITHVGPPGKEEIGKDG